jgi:hypothetical protein
MNAAELTQINGKAAVRRKMLSDVGGSFSSVGG